MKEATAAVRLLLEARSQIYYTQVQTDLLCVYNYCCLYNCNAMQWVEAEMRTACVSCPKASCIRRLCWPVPVLGHHPLLVFKMFSFLF